MAIGVNSVLSMGVGALFASQASIQTTGNNISNVNTEGYSRQAVVLQEKYSINYYPGQVGQGVQAQEIIRYFDSFIESNYLGKLSTASRYQSQYSQLRYVENLFNESNTDGIYNALSEMFKEWNTLAAQPDSLASREALLGKTTTLTQALRNADTALRDLENQMNTMIRQDVESANKLIQEIASLNKEIAANYQAGRNNPNQLMDLRDAKVRELATIIDVSVQDHGPGQYTVTMKNGNTLVQNEVPFSLSFSPPGVENNLTALSPYKTAVTIPGTTAQKAGTAHWSGSDSHEYTLEMVNDGFINPTSGQTEARFKVSLDGGKTWLSDDGNKPLTFPAIDEKVGSVRIGDMEFSFDAGEVAQGDRFVISPKTDVYWVSPTSGPINVSTQIFSDGTSNPSRITGGSLAGLIEFRDHDLGEYRDRLDALSKSIAWEVNRIHSQGAGLTGLSSMTGTYVVGDEDEPLGSPEARFTWADRLQAGNMTFSIFDENGHPAQPYPSLDVFDSFGNFNPVDIVDPVTGVVITPGHTLQNVVDAINGALAPAGSPGAGKKYFQAGIQDGKLQVSLNQTDFPGYTFAITADTTGLAAALGLNTFFTGDSAESIAVNDTLTANLNLINSGRLNTFGEINPGDNQTALEIAALTSKAVEIGTIGSKGSKQPLAEYYGTLVTRIGSDTSGAKYTAASETAIAQDLYDRQEEISGVNLDEEMSNLIKFQASYKAAAKLITTADEMLQTLLSLKQ